MPPKPSLLILFSMLAIMAGCSSKNLKMNSHYLLAPGNDSDRSSWLDDTKDYRAEMRHSVEETAGDEAWKIYERNDLEWMSRNFTCRMSMMYDNGFYDVKSNKYLIESVLSEGKKEFGGYDSIVLWHAYPRLGIDERNQFDFYRDMPGGLDGIRKLVKKCHAEGTKVFIDYNPWDTGTRREDKSDYQMLAEIIAAINADGVFLDTLSEGSEQLRAVLDETRPGLAIVSEGHPPVEQLSICSGSWGQWLNEPEKPGILKLKCIEPRHMQYQIRRWDRCHSDEIASAFFNGSGMLIWENIFGTYNPWKLEDRLEWKKANLILHFFADMFAEVSSEPYYPSKNKYVYINRWRKEGTDIFLLRNTADTNAEASFVIPAETSGIPYDVWNGRIIEPKTNGNKTLIHCPIKELGCVVISKDIKIDTRLQPFMQTMRKLTSEEDETNDSRNFVKSVVYADPVKSTPLTDKSEQPAGMVFIPGTVKTFEIEHIRGECGCYPDSEAGQPVDDFGYGLEAAAVYPQVIHEPIRHEIGPLEIKPFFIDEAEVTNAEYKEFLDSSGYEPEHKENFLKHWLDGMMPPESADYPVVYVDIDDARAYAKWAGKRLPTEFEWQLAAQGRGNRKWPWGQEFDPNNCNTTGTHTLPVRSLPCGKSPYGCYHMSGNVWEWTESCRDDGHTRFVMIRGGSYFNAASSIWYVKGGPQPCGHHAKFVRIWPGLDRCSTVGFRCVVDAR